MLVAHAFPGGGSYHSVAHRHPLIAVSSNNAAILCLLYLDSAPFIHKDCHVFPNAQLASWPESWRLWSPLLRLLKNSMIISSRSSPGWQCLTHSRQPLQANLSLSSSSANDMRKPRPSSFSTILMAAFAGTNSPLW
jgi:hypothetical protein